MRAWTSVALALALAVPLLAGCSQPAPPALWADEAPTFDLTLPVHVVAAGFADFDADAVKGRLSPLLPQFQWVRSYTTGNRTLEPLQYRIDYKVHEAPEAFAQDLFAFAKTVSRDDQPDSYLATYDANGEQRVCTPAPTPTVPSTPVTPSANPTAPACKDIQRIDAQAVEEWIAAHRGEHGLDFGQPGQTVFLLDGHSTGLLDPASYHQYEVKSPAQGAMMRNLRAWGGAHDFVFLDVGAAPNSYDVRPFGSFGPGAPNLGQKRDGPVWEYEGDRLQFYANLARDVSDAVRMLWARDPIYPFEYADRYILPFYVFIDPNAHSNPALPTQAAKPSDVQANTDEAAIRQAFADLAPWANVTVEFHYVTLPDGDAGVAAALQDAKDRSTKGTVDFGIVKSYFRTHWQEYAKPVPGAKVYPTFAFILGAPSQGLYAYSDGDEVGRSWGVFVNISDLLLCRTGVPMRLAPAPCFTEDVFGGAESWWAWWNSVLVHELGHSFGLTHTHDTPGLTEGGELTYDVNWLWDSTASVMTYRHTLGTFDAFDKELVLRNHATAFAMQALRSPGAPAAAADLARSALDAIAAGDYAGALEKARSAAAQVPGLGTVQLGLRGPVAPLTFEVAATGSPLGLPPIPIGLPIGIPVDPDAVVAAGQAFAIDLPADATAFELELKEADAPSHTGWAAYVAILDSKGRFLGGLFNNGYDLGVWEALDECAGACKGVLVPYGGAKSSYTVAVTPLFGSGPWPKA